MPLDGWPGSPLSVFDLERGEMSSIAEGRCAVRFSGGRGRGAFSLARGRPSRWGVTRKCVGVPLVARAKGTGRFFASRFPTDSTSPREKAPRPQRLVRQKILPHTHSSEKKSLRAAFQPGEPRLLFRVDRSDQDRPQPCQSPGQDVGKDLIADHRGAVGRKAHPPHGSPAAKRQRLHGLGDKRQPRPLGEAADPVFQAVGDQAQPDAGGPSSASHWAASGTHSWLR